jgi:hypothetical protein
MKPCDTFCNEAMMVTCGMQFFYLGGSKRVQLQ